MVTTATERAVDRYANVDGVRIHYRDIGDPEAHPVVVLHGIMGHSREWDTLTGALAGHFRVLAVDQRGHGESDWTDVYTATAFAGDLIGLIEHIGGAPAHIVGHSLGAMAAMLCAAERPDLVDRLVVIDIGPDSLETEWAAELSGFLEALAHVSYDDPKDAVDEWLVGDPLAQADLMRHYVEHCLVARDDGRLVWRFDAARLARFPIDGVTEEQLRSAVDRLTAATLVLRGEHSPLLSASTAERMVRRLGDGRLEEIAGGAHDLGVEQPFAVAVAVLRFLRS